MIAYLQGSAQIIDDYVIVTTHGVGYKVEVGSRTLSQVNQDQAEFYIYTYVREDRLELFGFLEASQLKLFEMMLEVSGVGPKTAIDIVDRSPDKIIEAVQNAQVNFFKNIPRIGKKTAQKIILELKPKLGSLKELSLGPRSAKEQDIYQALSSLGYEESDVGQILQEMDLEDLSIEETVKKILQQM